MIKLEHVNKSYNIGKKSENIVIKDLSLSLENKGLVMLLGKSGSGKSTLANLISGLDYANQGSIQIDDYQIDSNHKEGIDNIRNQHIGIVFQNYRLRDDMTVFENVETSLRLLGVTDEKLINQLVMECLEILDIHNLHHRYPRQLSGGQQQRVAIARAIIKRPSLILADEPTGNMDRKTTRRIMRLFAQIAKHTLVLMVTHEESLAERYADRVIRIQDGTILSDEAISRKENDIDDDGNIYLGDLNRIFDKKDPLGQLSIYTDNQDINKNLRLIFHQGTWFVDADAGQRIRIMSDDDRERVLPMTKAERPKEAPVPMFEWDHVEQTSPRHFKGFHWQLGWRGFRHRFQDNRILDFLVHFILFIVSASAFALGILLVGIIAPESSSVPRSVYAVSIDGNESVTQLEELSTSPDLLVLMTNNAYGSLILDTPKILTLSDGYPVTTYYSTSDFLSSKDLSSGKLPTSPTEIVISQGLADKIVAMADMQIFGVSKTKDLLEMDVFTVMSFDASKRVKATIVGIAKTSDNLVFVERNALALYNNSSAGEINAFSDWTVLMAGSVPNQDGEIMLNANDYEGTVSSFVSYDLVVGDVTFTVTGLFELQEDSQPITSPVNVLGNAGTVMKYLLQLHLDDATAYISASSTQSAEDAFSSIGLATHSLYELANMNSTSNDLFRSLLICLPLALLLLVGEIGMTFYFKTESMKKKEGIAILRSLGMRSAVVIRIQRIESVIYAGLMTSLSILLLSGSLLKSGDNQSLLWTIIKLLTGLVFAYIFLVPITLRSIKRLARMTPAELMVTSNT